MSEMIVSLAFFIVAFKMIHETLYVSGYKSELETRLESIRLGCKQKVKAGGKMMRITGRLIL